MLKGKIAVVTGSTSGIGLEIARELASSGCDVVLNGFGDAAEIEDIRAGIELKYSVRALYVNVDLSKGDQARKLINETIKEFGKIDILVNNAGVQHVAPIEDFDSDRWDLLIAVNLSATFHTMAEAVKNMKKNGWGRIVNIASAHGLRASANKSAYVASKHGVVGLTKVVALENARQDNGQNITCNAICPGWVLTPLVQDQVEAWAERDNIPVKDAEVALLSEKQPSHRFAKPEEIGAMVTYLCSDAARSVTGTTMSIDGGWTAK